MSARFKWTAWAFLLVALGVALAVGASRPSAPPTAVQRAASIDAALRCPSCEDISVADSSAPTAVAIRALVAARVREGESTAEIEGFLESRYGVGILLRPPASGLSAVVWIVPLVAVAGSIACLGVLFWRRRHPAEVAVDDEDRLTVQKAMARARVEVGS